MAGARGPELDAGSAGATRGASSLHIHTCTGVSCARGAGSHTGAGRGVGGGAGRGPSLCASQLKTSKLEAGRQERSFSAVEQSSKPGPQSRLFTFQILLCPVLRREFRSWRSLEDVHLWPKVKLSCPKQPPGSLWPWAILSSLSTFWARNRGST